MEQAGATMAVFGHPFRNCIYDEAREAAPQQKYRHEPLMVRFVGVRGLEFRVQGFGCIL